MLCGVVRGCTGVRRIQTYEFRNPVSETTVPIDRPPLQNELPEPTGDNKYTSNMVPGYTGQTRYIRLLPDSVWLRCFFRRHIEM